VPISGPLGRDGSAEGGLRVVERRESLVRACVDLVAAALLDRGRINRRCVSRTSGNSTPSERASAVDPSMSVKRKVTVPLGRATSRV
jgi:hypothetical protein